MFLRLLQTNILNVVLKKTLMQFMYVSNSGRTVSSYITYSNSLYRVESSQSLCCTASIALVFQLTCSHSLCLALFLFLCVFFYLFAGFCLFPLRLVKMAVILNAVVECVCADAVLVVIVVILLLLLLLLYSCCCWYTNHAMSHNKRLHPTCTSRLLFGNKFAG